MFEVLAVDVHADQVIMNEFIFRETNGLSTESFQVGSEVQILSF
jgi:hypothetical protein